MNKHLVIISLGRLSQMIIMFLTYRVLSSVLSVPDMGVYYFLLSISAAFGLIYANPIGMYANRMLHSWKEHGVLLRNLKTIVISLLVGSLLTIPFLFVFKQKISGEENQWALIVSTLVLYVFASTLNGTLIPGLNLLGFTNQFVLWTLFTNIVGLFLSYLLVIFVSSQPLYWLIGQGISFLIFGLLAYIILRRNIVDTNGLNQSLSLSGLKRVAKFGLPIVVTNLAVWVLGQSFRFFYKANVDSTILGELVFGLGLATSLSVAIEYLFQQLYFPEFYSKINDRKQDKSLIWNKLLNKLIPSYVYFTAFLIGLSPFLMRVLADVKFKKSAYFLALGACVEFLRMLGNIFTMATQSEMKTHKAIGPYLSGGFIALFGVLFICQHSEFVNYTPYALMAGYLTSLIFLAYNVGKLMKIDISLGPLVKCLVTSFVFLTALFFKNYSDSLIFSLSINIFFGVVLLFFLYRSYLNQIEV